MENEKIGFFKRLGIGLVKPKEYSKLAKQTVGNTIFTFLVVTIIQVAVIVALLVYVFGLVENMADQYMSKLPDFIITKDGITTNLAEPIIVEDEGQISLFIFDANTSLTNMSTTYSDKILPAVDYVLVGTDGIKIQSVSGSQLYNFDSKTIGDNEISKGDIIDFVGQFLQKTLIIAIAITLIIFLFIGKIIGGIVFALFGLIIANMQQKKIGFKELFNISMYAGTLTALMFLLGGFIYTVSSIWCFVQLVIICIYVYLAIRNYPIENNNIKIEIK